MWIIRQNSYLPCSLCIGTNHKYNILETTFRNISWQVFAPRLDSRYFRPRETERKVYSDGLAFIERGRERESKNCNKWASLRFRNVQKNVLIFYLKFLESTLWISSRLLEVVLKPADLVVFSHNVHIRLVFGRVSLQHRVRRPRVTEKVLVHQHLVPVVRVQGKELHPEECNQIKSFTCFDKNILHNNKLVQYIQQLSYKL